MMPKKQTGAPTPCGGNPGFSIPSGDGGLKASITIPI
ncbi:MAG: hypothetical protein JWQ87_2932 [Candidatus Sulfotelmatobacter sp.]|nr:hypothetical protein [Candidatus Sulfotelmatobacter sp.]